MNCWKDGQAKIDALANAKIIPITNGKDKDGKDIIIGYQQTPEFDALITEMEKYQGEENFQN